MYSYQIQIIFKQIYLTHIWEANSEPRSNVNEEYSTLPVYSTIYPSEAEKR